MFESLREKLTGRDLSTVSTLLRILGVLWVLAAMATSFQEIDGEEWYAIFEFSWLSVMAAFAFATAHGIDQQRLWGKWLGYVLGLLLVPVRRANEAGWFTTAPPVEQG